MENLLVLQLLLLEPLRLGLACSFIYSLMSPAGSGKTSFANTVSGSRMPVGNGLESCTTVVELSLPFMIDGRRAIILDTPGFDDTTKRNAEILENITQYLAKTSAAQIIPIMRIEKLLAGTMKGKELQESYTFSPFPKSV